MRCVSGVYEEGCIRAHRGSMDSNVRAREQRAKKETVTSLEGEEQARAEGVGTKVFLETPQAS